MRAVGCRKALIWILAVLTAALLLAGSLWALALHQNEYTLEVRLLGEPRVRLEYGETYTEAGASATLYGTLFWREGIAPKDVSWQVEGAVEESRLGRYTIDYTAACRGVTGRARRVVEVVDTQSPKLTLTEEGPTAFDNYDGDITDKIIRTEEPGLVSYAVVDSSGNPAYLQEEVSLPDQPPVITLEGGDHIRIPAGIPYQDPGYRAADERGDLTEAVEVSGEVTWYLRGTYPVTYRVRDAEGNESVAERLVEVQPQERPKVRRPEKKTIYLTFDDGPGPYTETLLDVLDKYEVKATFFVTDSGYDEAMAEIVRRGHSIGIHTVSHDYEEIYADPQAFFEDLYEMQNIILENTGVRTTLMRFPGGSSNTVSCGTYEGLMTILTEAVQDAGFQYFDWNIDSNDAGGAKKPSTVLENVKEGIRQQGTGIVLQHDIHPYSVEAVEDILRWGLDNGYRFAPLTENTPGYHHGVNN